jgi:hypothetical protein
MVTAMKRSAIIAAVGITLAGCSPTAGTAFYDANGQSLRLSDISSNGTIEVDVGGNPFNVPPEVLASAVAGAMNQAGYAPAVTFSATPLGYLHTFSVRIILNPPAGMSYVGFCAGTPPTPPGTPGARPIHLLGAVCQEQRWLAFVDRELIDASGPEDPRFVAFIREETVKLMAPFANP